MSPWHYSSGWVVWGGLIAREPTAFPERWKQREWSGAKAWCAAISPCWTIQGSLVTSMWVACVNKLTRVREREREREKVKSLDWSWFSHVAQLLDLSWWTRIVSQPLLAWLHFWCSFIDCVNVHWCMTKYVVCRGYVVWCKDHNLKTNQN